MSSKSSISPTADFSSTKQSSSSPSPLSSPLSYPSLIPSISPRIYRSCSSPRVQVGLTFDGPGKTLQSFKDECDINRIMKRYQQTGVIDHVNRAQPQFGDFDEIDFQASMNIVLEAEARFAALPAELRDRFGNDPGRLLDFIQDPQNAEEGVKLGLLNAPPPKVGVVPPPPANLTTAAVAPPTAPPTPSPT